MTALCPERTLLDLSGLSDEVLVQLAQGGDRAAFTTLVQRHEARVLQLARGVMRSEAEAWDAVQDAYLNAWRKIESFRGDAAFSSWLYRITHNACLMRLRSRRRRPEVALEVRRPGDPDGVERPVIDPDPLADEGLEVRELGRAIERAMQSLPASYRQVFELADLQHRSMKDIADVLDLTVPNVKTRLHRARLRLRDQLAPYLSGAPQAAIA